MNSHRDANKRYVKVVRSVSEKPDNLDSLHEWKPTYDETECEFCELRKGDIFRLFEPEGKAVFEEGTGFVYAIADSELEHVEKEDGTFYLAIKSRFISPAEIFV